MGTMKLTDEQLWQIEDAANEYADSIEKHICAYRSGLKQGFIEATKRALSMSSVVGKSDKLFIKSCNHACSPSDFYKGGKCDKMGCYDSIDPLDSDFTEVLNELEGKRHDPTKERF